jgi:ATP-dependent helicase/DNAse subunit B
MPAQVFVIAGPSLAGKTTQLLARYRQQLSTGLAGSALWLSPNQRAAFDVRGRLLADTLDACFSPGVMTFASFASAVVSAAATPIRPISSVTKRHLIHRLINAARASGRLRYFRPIAETAGLVDLVDGWISEMKRLEIWPAEFRSACQARGMTEKDAELLDLYEAYQQVLTRHNLFDAEGRFWSARALLRGGQRRPFENLELVVADGFTDFTRTQHEILELLAERVDELWISLPLEPPPRRDDLFAKSLATLGQLRRSHPKLDVIDLARPETPAWPALSHLERELFKSPRHVQPAADARGVEILAAPRQYGEIELVGKRIKELLLDGPVDESVVGIPASAGLANRRPEGGTPTRPEDIAVVFRSLIEVAPLVREVFTELGIPFALESGQPLNDSPALASLVGLLNLHRDDWPFRQVLAVLGNSYFQPAWPEWRSGRALAPAERAIRQLQVPSGRHELLRRLKRRAEQSDNAASQNDCAENTPQVDNAIAADAPSSDPRKDERQARQRYEAQAALGILTRLDEALAGLPHSATPTQWAEAIEQLAGETGFLRVIDQAEEGAARPTQDRIAWTRLRDALCDAADLAQWLDEPASPVESTSRHELNLTEMLELLLDILRCEQLPGDHDEVGRVRVLSVHRARTLSVPYLFFAGLSEHAMPAPDREDRLYSDAENRQLREKGLPLVLRAQRNQDEMLLFYETLTRARRYLLLSYPALDEKAQPLLPSPYLLEVERALGEGRVRRHVEPDLSPIPRNSQPLSASDLRLQGVAQALSDQPRLLAGLIQHAPNPAMVENLTAGLSVTCERARPQGFGPHEGILASPESADWLARQYGPEHCWSASDLEAYATCPYRFLLEKVLRLEPLPELTLATDFQHRGWLLHAALARLHRHLAGAPSTFEPAEFESAVSHVLSLLVSLEETDATLARALREVDVRILSRWLLNYHQQHQEYDKRFALLDAPPRPAHFEASFGMQPKDDEPADPISVLAPLVLEIGGEAIRFQGRIDRIDIGRLAGRTVFNVLDYKSGKPLSKKKREAEPDGTLLQLEVYALAAEKLFLAAEGALPLESAYWYVRESGYKAWMTHSEEQAGEVAETEAWTTRRRQLLETILALVRGIRAGHFPVSSRDEQCTGHCPYSTACRINQVRSLEKVWEGAATS